MIVNEHEDVLMTAVSGANERAGNVRVHESPGVRGGVQFTRVRQLGGVGLTACGAAVKPAGGEQRWSVSSELRELT
eukprot:5640949-Pleurochrysis_carterae.AAC.3